eukprot:85220_1
MILSTILVFELFSATANIINDKEWFDDDLWDVINANIHSNVDQKCMKDNDGYICVCRNSVTMATILCENHFESRRSDDNLYGYYDAYQYEHQIPEDLTISDNEVSSLVKGHGPNIKYEYTHLFPLPHDAKFGVGARAKNIARSAAFNRASGAAAVAADVGADAGHEAINGVMVSLNAAVAVDPTLNVVGKADAAGIANAAALAQAKANAKAVALVQAPAALPGPGQRVQIARNAAGEAAGDAAADAIQVPREYSRHHVIPKIKLKLFWNDLVRNNHFVISGLAAFLQDTVIGVFDQNDPNIYHADIAIPANNGIASSNLPASVNAKINAIRLMIPPINPHGAPVTSAEVKIIQKFYLWMPWNIFIGPSSNIRYDDTGSLFESGFRKVSNVDALQYYSLKNAYKAMYAYHFNDNPSDALRAVTKLKNSALQECGTHSNVCAALRRGTYSVSNPSKEECLEVGCCWNDQSWNERRKASTWQCSEPQARANARTFIDFTLGDWKLARDKENWALS